jgi:hypothetical protein
MILVHSLKLLYPKWLCHAKSEAQNALRGRASKININLRKQFQAFSEVFDNCQILGSVYVPDITTKIVTRNPALTTPLFMHPTLFSYKAVVSTGFLAHCATKRAAIETDKKVLINLIKNPFTKKFI